MLWRLFSVLLLCSLSGVRFSQGAQQGLQGAASSSNSQITLQKFPNIYVDVRQGRNVFLNETGVDLCVYSNVGRYNISLPETGLIFHRIKEQMHEIRYGIGVQVLAENDSPFEQFTRQGDMIQSRLIQNDMFMQNMCKNGWSNVRLIVHVDQDDFRVAPRGVYFDALTVLVSLN